VGNLQLEYSTGFIILCGLLALGLSLFLYFKDSRWKDKAAYIPIVLGLIRFGATFLLSFLLLSPYLTYFDQRTESPLLLLAVDNSESIQSTPDSTLQQFKVAVDQWESRFSNYELEILSLGESVKPLDSLSFDEQQTNLSALMDYIDNQYAGRTVGALVIASDGLYNVGQNPMYSTNQFSCPIYTLGLGDTTKRRDALVKQIFHNDIVYLGDQFLLQVDIEAEQMNGLTSKVQLLRKRNDQFQLVEEKAITYEGGRFFTTVEFKVAPNQAGLQQYKVQLSQQNAEASFQNNSKDFYIEVIDGRQKILIASAQPHPDLTALRQILTQYGNYEIELKLLQQATPNVVPEQYDLLILHQLPSQRVNQRLQKVLLENQQPKLFLLGKQADLTSLNRIQKLLQITPMNGSPNLVDAAFHNNFNAFQIDPSEAVRFENFPPMEAPFGKYAPTGNLQVLFHQRIGDLTTEYPLIAIGEERGVRIGFINGEGLWRWRLFDFMDDQEHNSLNTLVDQMIKYLSIKEDRRRFKLTPSARLINENESISFRAELYNESFEPVTDEDITMTIRDEDNKEYNFLFSRAQDFYSLDAGFLAPGNYTYEAAVSRNGQNFKEEGSFSVEKIQLERYQTQANRDLLRTLSAASGGSYFEMDELEALSSEISDQQSLKDVLYTTARTQGFIDLKWIFWVLFALLASEWIARRLAGTY
jgi:hypothetical protein